MKRRSKFMKHSRKRVLLVDDETDLIEVLRMRLERAGFAVETAGDGFEALEKARSFNPDVVLLDMVMPDMEGWEVCRRLKIDPATRKVPVVIMTASRVQIRDCERRALSAGATCLLMKPFEAEELIHALGMKTPDSPEDLPVLGARSGAQARSLKHEFYEL